ncbi:hypothetical protein C7M46_00013 [Pediococcus pentosaceus]|uniref:hypothetical protein n=1 Tax=Pediococcus pentosaceus TaxID=1255 RepID=UPI0013629903|nr:hypothetical protein [Pediococcus pentosaceus]QHM59370.1 hypothetical protein C7M46_00013 [Pediococcus pentosaceus]
MYAGKKVSVQEINFLDSEKFVSFTRQADSKMTGVVDGHLPAGTVYPSNDAKAVGITINDVDVSDGPQPVGVIVEGYVNAKRLPVAPSAEAITAMKEIKLSHVEED